MNKEFNVLLQKKKLSLEIIKDCEDKALIIKKRIDFVATEIDVAQEAYNLAYNNLQGVSDNNNENYNEIQVVNREKRLMLKEVQLINEQFRDFIKCDICGDGFKSNRANAKFCSTDCRRKNKSLHVVAFKYDDADCKNQSCTVKHSKKVKSKIITATIEELLEELGDTE